MALVKSGVLFALVALLVKAGSIDVLPLVVGFAALPLGIVLTGMWPIASAREES